MYEETRAEGFGAEVKRRILIGTYVLSAGYYDAYYLKAQKVRSLIKRDFDQAFEKVDVILTPATPTPAFALGSQGGSDPIAMYLNDIFTVTVNMAGLPGLSVPAGRSAEGLPLGLQIIGKPFDEGLVLRAGQLIEDAVGRMPIPEPWWQRDGTSNRQKASPMKVPRRKRLRKGRGLRRQVPGPGGPQQPQHREKSSMALRKAEECENMDHVRVEIDRIDDALLDLVAERFTYVDRAWQLKSDPAEATVPWRIRQVIDKVEARAKERGLPPGLAAAFWRQMIGWFIQYEEEKLAKRSEQAKSSNETLTIACIFFRCSFLDSCRRHSSSRAEGADLKVEVSGLRNYKGHVVLWLWAVTEQARFPDPSKVQYRDERAGDLPCDFPQMAICRRIVSSLQDLTVSYTFKSVPPGDYAVFVFHDENNNKLLDTGMFKRPLEASGYSQLLPDEVKPLANKITFQQAHFTLSGPKTITIGLRYPPRL